MGRRGEAPLVPPYSFRRPNKTMALTGKPAELTFNPDSDNPLLPKPEARAKDVARNPFADGNKQP